MAEAPPSARIGPEPTAIDEHPEPGWPRPYAEFDRENGAQPERLPMPWVLRIGYDGKPLWTEFHDGCDRAHYGRLCQICGEELRAWFMFGRGQHFGRTSGPGCHPRCMALALRHCPHLAETAEPAHFDAYAYCGPWLGYDYDREGVAHEGAYPAENGIMSQAIALSREQVAGLVSADPFGDDPEALEQLLG